MDDILKISDFINDENPFRIPIKEMAVTTGAIPMAPLNGSGFAGVGDCCKTSTKKKKKKKKEKNKGFFTADPQSGKPKQKGSSVLYSGIEDEKHIEETRKKRVRSRLELLTAQYKTVKKKLTPPENAIKSLPKIFQTGGTRSKEQNPDDEYEQLEQRVEGNPMLSRASQRMSLIVSVLRTLEANNCVLLRHYNRINGIYRVDTGSKNPHNAWQTEQGMGGGISMDKPPTGWWGVHKWSAADLDKYKIIYINQIYAKYLQQVRIQFDAHGAVCEGERNGINCRDVGHAMFLKELYCTGVNPDTKKSWDLGHAVKIMAKQMKKRKRAFQASRRGNAKVRPKTPPEDIVTGDRARRIKKERGVVARLREIDPFARDGSYAASWRQFFGMEDEDEPKVEDEIEESRNSHVITPLEISKMIEDPDDTSL